MTDAVLAFLGALVTACSPETKGMVPRLQSSDVREDAQLEEDERQYLLSHRYEP